eukprot:scaffold384975_cov38-Prasinocladus_malaysianus.AAC.1
MRGTVMIRPIKWHSAIKGRLHEFQSSLSQSLDLEFAPAGRHQAQASNRQLKIENSPPPCLH